jgi:hypothetical protein
MFSDTNGYQNPMSIGSILDSLRSYYAVSAHLALGTGRNRVTTLLDALWFRLRYGMSGEELAFYSLDGRKPAHPDEFITGKDDIYAFMRKRMIRRDRSRAVDNKLAFHLRCTSNSIPTSAKVLAVAPAGADISTTGVELPFARTPGEFEQLLDGSHLQEFFCKPLSGQNGNGGFGFKRLGKGFSARATTLSGDELFEQIRARADKYRTMIVEERLRLHPSMRGVSPSGALSTVRMVTALENGQVRVIAAILKICAGNNETDNFHQGLTGNLIANIDLKSGQLSKAISSANRDFPVMRTFDRHPDSQQLLEGFQLPDWTKLLSLVDAAHREFSEFWTLGWDMALSDRGPVIVEANPVWAVEFLQLASGRGLRPQFDRWKQELAQGQVSLS